MLFALFKKDIVQEIRTKETVTFLVTLSILLSVIVAMGLNNTMQSPQVTERLFPCLFWIVFIFTATIATGRSFESEREHMAIDGLIVSGVPGSAIFLSKVFSNTIVVFIGAAVSFTAMAILLNAPVFHAAFSVLLLALPVIVAFSSVSCLTMAIAAGSRSKGLLLPVILLPLLFPVFFCAMELTYQILESGGSVDPRSFWLSLLIALNVVYMILGLNLYEHVIKE